KSIDEIRSYGVSILPANKGPGSVSQGIQLVQGQRISLTKQSVNTIKEYRNYIWLTDKDGKIVNEPDPKCANHSMDAGRYGMNNLNAELAGKVSTIQTQKFLVNEYSQQLNSTK